MSELSPRLTALVSDMESGLAKQAGEDFIRLGEGLCYARACTSLPDAEAVSRMNLTPSGTSHGWQLCDEPDEAPVPCEDNPATHRHLVFEC